MYIYATPDNKGHKDGYYCTLVESKRINGVPKRTILQKFGFVPSERLPYLKAAFNKGNPEEILKKELSKMESLKEEI